MSEIKNDEKIEAYGVKGMNNISWRKIFLSVKDLNKWVDKNDATVNGTRKIGSMKIKMADAANPVTKILWLKGPNKNKFDWMKMDMIKKYLQKDRDILVLANKNIDNK